ncbi:hypothetical protein [Sediminibacter sp. Hel_I_10]|uniref:hypothetical protein n=1 Tax=Sediminibacter sp. Hel_I_10 TaxID=1392490 RepID=UPI0012DCB21C|nr:hypothetical protein [Sediminibacter sp. Hel_I_10]
MKKIIGILILSITMFSFTQIKMDGYISLFENSSSAKYYKYGKSYYFESFDNNKEIIADKEYYVKYRKYGWGDVDTTYYRKGTENYYHIDKKTLEESIVLPVNPKLGDKWTENDKSWSYEVIAEDKKFKTPAKKYINCITVNCKQLTNRNKEKAKEYVLYYSPEFGYVGNVDSKGKILSYLSEVKLNAKEGEKIGGK